MKPVGSMSDHPEVQAAKGLVADSLPYFKGEWCRKPVRSSKHYRAALLLETAVDLVSRNRIDKILCFAPLQRRVLADAKVFGMIETERARHIALIRCGTEVDI